MGTGLSGGCACGAVRYEISGAPVSSVQCQCRDCQRATGSGHVNAMAFPQAAVMLTGELRFHDIRATAAIPLAAGSAPIVGLRSCGSSQAIQSCG